MRRLSLAGFCARGLDRLRSSCCTAWLGILLLTVLTTARADAQTGAIAGMVTDAVSGAGLAAVTVNVYSTSGERAGSAITSEAGGYSVPDLVPGRYFVRTVTPALLSYVDQAHGDVPCVPCAIVATKPVDVTRNTVSPISFTLAPGGGIAGTLTDAASSVGLSGRNVEIFSSAGKSVKVATTNGSGAYIARGLPPGTYFAKTALHTSDAHLNVAYGNVLCASCSVTATTPIVVIGTATTTGIDFAAPAGGSVSGTVTTTVSSGALVGVTMQIFSSTGALVEESQSTSGGAYRLEGLAAGTYFVRTAAADSGLNYIDQAYAGTFCPCEITKSTPITVTAGSEVSGVDFELGPGSSITGTVTDADTGGPLSPVAVMLYSASGSELRTALSNRTGVYSFTGLAPGNYFLRTFVPSSLNYIDEAHGNTPCLPCTVTSSTPLVVDRPSLTADFELAPGLMITGTVVDALTGSPLPSVSIDALLPDGTSTGRVGTTDGSGTYWIKGLPAGTYHARTRFGTHYVPEVFNDMPCPYLQCTVHTSTPIDPGSWSKQAAVNFRLTPRTARDLVLDFGPSAGLFTLSPWSTWQRIHMLSPIATAVGDIDGNGADDLVVNFGAGIGIYAWMNHNTWTSLQAATPKVMAIGDLDGNGADDLLAVFPGSGLWRWAEGAWTRLHAAMPSRLAVGRLDTTAGDDLVVDFPGAGLFVFANNSTWTFLHASSPTAIATGDRDGNGQDEVLLAIPGAGLWEFGNNRTWRPLHPLTPTRMATGHMTLNRADDLVVEFGGGLGLWSLDGSGEWSSLHRAPSRGFILADRDRNGQDEVIVNFGPKGLWQFTNNSVWTLLNPVGPASLVSGNLH